MKRGWLKEELRAAVREVRSWPKEKRDQTPVARWKKAKAIVLREPTNDAP